MMESNGVDVDLICPERRMIVALRDLIEKQYKYQKGQNYYSDKLNVTYYYLNTLTKKYLGKTVYQLLQDRLLKESIFLLTETAFSAKTIAYQLGFSDPSNFGKFMKEYTGMTPRGYRSLRGANYI